VISKYAVGGAVGAVFYIEPIQTQDIDIFVHLEIPPGSFLVSTTPITDRLKELGYTLWREDKVIVENWPIQFLPAGKPIESEAIDQAIEKQIDDEVSVWVPPAEYLMLMAIDLGRPKDMIRLQQFHAEHAYDPQKLKALLEKHQLAHKWERVRSLLQLEEN